MKFAQFLKSVFISKWWIKLITLVLAFAMVILLHVTLPGA